MENAYEGRKVNVNFKPIDWWSSKYQKTIYRLQTFKI